MSTYTSECSPYNTDDEFPDQERATINLYTPAVPDGDFAPFPITVVKSNLTSTPRNYDVTFGTSQNYFIYSISYSSSGVITITTNPPLGIQVIPNGYVNTIILGSVAPNSTLRSGTYRLRDTYILNLEAICSGIQATLLRPLLTGTFGGTLGNNSNSSVPSPIPCTECSCLTTNNCKKVNIPIVNILGQVTVDYSDIGDVIFTICDKYQYYDCERIVCNENKCSLSDYIKPKDLKQTKFRECCPFMVSVLKGEGETLKEKSDYLWELNKEELGISPNDFYMNIIFYGMTKYILSRILYGKFNINYLLGKYNKRFLKDLGRSRFCGAVELYLNCENPSYGYNKYFLETCK